MRKVTATMVVALIVSGVVLSPVAAFADDPPEGVPPSALPGCQDPGEAGGWALRSFVTKGRYTSADDVREARPRSLVLGEPCVGVTGELAVPVKVSEIPIEGWEPFEPGNEWGPEGGSDGTCDQLVNSGSTTGLPVASLFSDPEEFPVACNKIVLNWSSGPNSLRRLESGGTKEVTVSTVEGNPRQLRFAWEGTLATHATDSIGGAFRVICGSATTHTGVEFQAAQLTYSSVAPTSPQTVTCSSGLVPLYGYWELRSQNEVRTPPPITSERRYGILWRWDGGEVEGTEGGYVRGYKWSLATIGFRPFNAQTSAFYCADERGGGAGLEPVDQTYTVGNPLYNDGTGTEIGTPRVVPDGEGGTVVTWVQRTDMVLVGDLTEEGCAYLVKIDLEVCVWVDSTSTGEVCVQTQWNYQSYKHQNPYHELDGTNPLGDLCDVAPSGYDMECFEERYVIPPDYGTLEGACKEPPEASLVNAEWIVPSIIFWTDCLWVPKGGWDYDRADGARDGMGPIEAAWDTSAVGELGDVATAAVGSFQWSESCGVIFNSTSVAAFPMVIDTCAWSWASPINVLLSVGIAVAFGMWFLTFIFKVTLSIVNKKVVLPIGDDDK